MVTPGPNLPDSVRRTLVSASISAAILARVARSRNGKAAASTPAALPRSYSRCRPESDFHGYGSGLSFFAAASMASSGSSLTGRPLVESATRQRRQRSDGARERVTRAVPASERLRAVVLVARRALLLRERHDGSGV